MNAFVICEGLAEMSSTKGVELAKRSLNLCSGKYLIANKVLLLKVE